MTSSNDDKTSVPENSRTGYSNDPRNPGVAGMPGANPGLDDPGQHEAGGRSAGSAEGHTSVGGPATLDGQSGVDASAPDPSPEVDLAHKGPAASEEGKAASMSIEDRAALDRWSGEGGSN